MGTLTLSGRTNLYDVQKLKAPNGGAVENTNTLLERNDLLNDLPALPSNGGLFVTGSRTNSLPTSTLTNIGGTWGSSKSERTPFVEALATTRSRFQSPEDVLQTEGPEVSQMLVTEEKNDHLESMGQTWSNLIISGPDDQDPNQSSIVGLASRAPYKTIDNEFTYDTGGTGSNLRSAWLMQPGPRGVHLAYNPNHPTLGVEMREMGRVFVQDPTAASLDAAEGRWDIIIEFMLQQGFVIRDQRAVKRIANIPVGGTTTPGADLINNVIRAANKHSSTMSKTWMLYCDADVHTQLILGANDQLHVYTSNKNIYQTELPMIGPNIIIRRLDSLNHAIDAGENQIV